MGMDRKIEKKYWNSNRIMWLTIIFAVGSLSIYAFGFMDNRSSLNVDIERVTISEVHESMFQESLPVSGVIQPIETNYLDAVEGGMVQQVYLESGDYVNKGDTILVLSNSTLQLQVMQQTSGLYDQINNVRNSRLNLDQNSLQLREQLAESKTQMEILQSDYERYKMLFESKAISEQDFLKTKKEFLFQKKRYELIKESYQKDSLQNINQRRQLNESEVRMYESLTAVQQILQNLIITAPISGQLSMNELHQGQSIQPGERIGQVDVLDKYKVRVQIDEYHLPRITRGLTGEVEIGGKTHVLEVTKIYPAVTGGYFSIDMEFADGTPEGLRRGQTLRFRINLSHFENAMLLNKGGFFQSTGGKWVYLLKDDDAIAVKHPITIGRENPDHYEIISGLNPGDKVITSSYSMFGDNDILILK